MPMLCKCNVVEFTSDSLKRELGRSWDLGPVVISKELGSKLLSVFVARETLENAILPLEEFKRALSATGNAPFLLKMSVKGDRGPYDFGEIEFDESVLCSYNGTSYSINKIEIKLETNGKELSIFGGNSDQGEQPGSQKPLFWASLLKRDIH